MIEELDWEIFDTIDLLVNYLLIQNSRFFQ